MSAERQQDRIARTPAPRPFSPSPAPQADWQALLQEITRAILAERNAAAGEALIHPRAFSLVGRTGDSYVYTVALDRPRPHLSPKTPLAIRVGSMEYPAHVLEANDTTFSLMVDREIPPGDDEVCLVTTDTAWLWDAVLDRLSAVWPGRVPPRYAGRVGDRGLMEGLLSATVLRRTTAVPLSVGSRLRLTDEQRQAAEEALRCGIYYLWGPPGTGKSFTVTELAISLLQDGRRTLVVAGSNRAANVVASMLDARLAARPDLGDGTLVRLGAGAGPRFMEEVGDRVDPSRIAVQRAERASVLDQRCVAVRGVVESLAAKGMLDARLESTAGAYLTKNGAVAMEIRRTASADAVTAGAAVVVATAHHLAVSAMPARGFDTVIIDEASQLSLPLALLAAAHARSGVIVAGDPMQLPPVVRSSCEHTKRIIGRSVYAEAGIIRRPDSAVSTMLTEQHRMAPRISRLVSSLAYRGRLRPHRSVLVRHAKRIGRELGELLYLDTSSLGPRTQTLRGGSRCNPTHIGAVAATLGALERAGMLDGLTIGAVSPFRAQAAGLSAGVGGYGAAASTIHAYQGAERDLVVLDLTDAEGAPVSMFLRADGPTDVGGTLLTVALSRAREALLVVADFSYLGQNGGRYVRTLLAMLKEYGTSLSALGAVATSCGRIGADRGGEHASA